MDLFVSWEVNVLLDGINFCGIKVLVKFHIDIYSDSTVAIAF